MTEYPNDLKSKFRTIYCDPTKSKVMRDAFCLGPSEILLITTCPYLAMKKFGHNPIYPCFNMVIYFISGLQTIYQGCIIFIYSFSANWKIVLFVKFLINVIF